MKPASAAVWALLAVAAPVSARAQAAAPSAPAAGVQADADEDLEAICTDRPTKSNYACTVEAGHFQYETDIFNGSFLRLHGQTTDVYLATNPTLKYGLTDDLDVEANIAPYVVVRTHDRFGATSTLGGVGDLYLRVKWNFYEGAKDRWSLAALPYVKVPTARSGIGDGAVEGGVLLPVNYKLTDTVTLTTVPEVDVYEDAAGGGRHVNSSQLLNVGWSLPHGVTLFGELWGSWNHDPAGVVRQYSFDTAVSWGVTKLLQLDAGLNLGLNRSTPGVQAYVGVSQKF